jgi:hypothetical protein
VFKDFLGYSGLVVAGHLAFKPGRGPAFGIEDFPLTFTAFGRVTVTWVSA